MIEQFIDSRGPWFRWVVRDGRLPGLCVRVRHVPATETFAVQLADAAAAIEYEDANATTISNRDLDELIDGLQAIRKMAERLNRLRGGPT